MDSKIVQVALNGLENILRFGEQESKNSGGSNPYAVIIEEVFGLDKIEFLQVNIIQCSTTKIYYQHHHFTEP